MMARGSAFAVLCALSIPALAQVVPSGQTVELEEVLVEDVGGETWLRFRFLAPAIAREGGQISFAQAEADLAYLCKDVALPYIQSYQLTGQVVIITLQDRKVEFGQADSGATQFIDGFRIETGDCILEIF